MYLAISAWVVNAILVAEWKKEKMSVYYISHALTGAELNYPLIEKFAFALVLASRKFCAYFEVHKVIVLTDQPLKGSFTNLMHQGDY